MKPDYDLIIVGAGMVGATLAALLADTGLRIALLDRNEPKPFDIAGAAQNDHYDLRLSAVNLASEQLFRRLGIWSTIVDTRATAFRKMRVWDAAGRGQTEFASADLGEPWLGHIVENGLINHSLLTRALQSDNVTGLWGVSPENIDINTDCANIVLDTGERLRAQLVVGADGGRSRVRTLTGIEATTHNYQQRTLVGLVHAEQSHGFTAWQRFLGSGPIALLPLRNNLCSLAWHLDHNRADALQALNDVDFGLAIGEHTGHVLGEIKVTGPRGGFDLHRLHAHRYVGDRIALIGDAAHVIHPLAGLGVNLGFMDAACLGGYLLEAPAAELGDARRLRAYARRRRMENSLAVATTDAFKHGFGSDATLIQSIRNLGLNLADRAGPLKHQVVRYAMGLSGDVPALAQRSATDVHTLN